MPESGFPELPQERKFESQAWSWDPLIHSLTIAMSRLSSLVGMKLRLYPLAVKSSLGRL
jgi:hypothetical protein